MFRPPENRRQTHKIFIFGQGKSLRFDIGKKIEVEDDLGYKILAESSYFIKQVVEPVEKKPKQKKKTKAKMFEKEKVRHS